MRWESVSTTTDKEVYNLYNSDLLLLTITLHPFSNYARVECNKEKRIFFIRKEGFLRNKTVLLCEYGTKIGELGKENNVPFIVLNNERFYYSKDENKNGDLIIYKDNIDNPIVICNSAIEFKKDKHLSDTAHPGLLMALCWYMFLPAPTETPISLALV